LRRRYFSWLNPSLRQWQPIVLVRA
jgi:hypothetical protein